MKTELEYVTADNLMTGRTWIPKSNDVSVNTRNIVDELEERLKKLERTHKFDYTMLQCRNCGASLEQKIDDHIVKCPYCSTAYIVGNWQINS